MGPIEQTVAVGAPVRGDTGTTKLPLLVMSHGTGGSTLGHFDTAVALADAGFVVAAGCGGVLRAGAGG
jgi:predicted dienelactone hydrolase